MTPAATTVTLREAVLEDVPAIVAVQARSWRTAYRGIVDDDFLDNIPIQKWIDSWRVHFFGGAQTRCFLAEAGGRVVGFSSAGRAGGGDEVEDSTGEVHTIYTDPAYYGQGIGRRLMAAALDQLSDDGFSAAVLWVLEANERARRFYEAGGWKADGASASDCWGATSVPRIRYRRALG